MNVTKTLSDIPGTYLSWWYLLRLQSSDLAQLKAVGKLQNAEVWFEAMMGNDRHLN
jgi:hypothetical protein